MNDQNDAASTDTNLFTACRKLLCFPRAHQEWTASYWSEPEDTNARQEDAEEQRGERAGRRVRRAWELIRIEQTHTPPLLVQVLMQQYRSPSMARLYLGSVWHSLEQSPYLRLLVTWVSSECSSSIHPGFPCLHHKK